MMKKVKYFLIILVLFFGINKVYAMSDNTIYDNRNIYKYETTSKNNYFAKEYFRLNHFMLSIDNNSLSNNGNDGHIINDCKGLIGNNTLKMLNLFLNFLMIIGPIIALVLGTYDLIVALANGEEDAKKKGIKKMKNRLIAAALLLLVPYIIKLILNIAGRGGTDCIEAMQNLLIFRSNI